MDIKEANSLKYSNKSSFDIKIKKRVEKYARIKKIEEKNFGEKIKSFHKSKPNRYHFLGIPRHKQNNGNSLKWISPVYSAFVLMIDNRKTKKAYITSNIDLISFM